MESLHVDAQYTAFAREQVLGVFKAAFDAFNRGDLPAFEAAWADEVDAIMNQAPPYVWTGNDALRSWLAASGADASIAGVTRQSIAGGPPHWLEIVGDRAFVVMPVVLRFEQGGIRLQQRGRQVCVLIRTPHGWRFKSLAYGGEAVTNVVSLE
jgi:ketosteroid isomerase-like protein